MKERPILMTPENAQKCFDGVKTQTRRIIKPQPHEGMTIRGPEMYAPVKEDKFGEIYPGEDVFGVYDDSGEWGAVCKFGQPGDRLWIREAWAPAVNHGGVYLYKGTVEPGDFSAIKFWPSIHMPRWACRTVVEITDIRVERLQAISVEDIQAEGVECSDEPETKDIYIQRWRHLWESINGPWSWALNPFVWAITFKRIK